MNTNSLAIRNTLLDKNLTIFTSREFGTVLSFEQRKSWYYLEKGVKEGLFTQLKKGLYCLKTDQPSEQEISSRLYQPSYISFEYALAFYNILPEMVYTVTNATTKPTREFMVEDKTYRYTTIKVKAYTGYELKMLGEKRYQIAEPEKALADYLYMVSLGRRALSERLVLSTLNKAKVLTYAKLFGNASSIDLIHKTFS